MTPSEQLHTLPLIVPDPNEATAFPILAGSDSPYQESLRVQLQYQSPDPDNPAWGLGGALLVWFASVVLIVVMPVIFLLPYASSKGLHTGMPNYAQAITEFALTDKTAILLQVVSLLPSHLLTLLLVWALVTRFGKQSFWAAIGWDWPSNFPWWISVLLGVILFGLGGFIAWLFGAEKPTQLEQIINSSLAARYTISVLAVCTAPFVEELIYRGVLYAPLQRLVGVPGAVIAVLALFTVIHVPQYWPNVGIIAAVALLSIVLTVVRAYSRRLLPCVAIHLVFNGIQAAILIAEPQMRRLVPPVQPTAVVSVLLPLIRSIL